MEVNREKLLKNSSKVLTLLFLSVLFFFNASAQDSFMLASGTEVNIEGSSTLHSWKAIVNKTEGKLQASSKFAKMKLKDGADIGTVSLKFEVATIDGGRGETMNDKIKNALKATTSPYIEFEGSESAKISSITDKSTNKFMVASKGNLSMAGVTKPVEIILEGTYTDANTIHFKGSYEMKMSDFEIEKPSAMFGTIVAGDDIKINFNLIFSNKTNKS